MDKAKWNLRHLLTEQDRNRFVKRVPKQAVKYKAKWNLRHLLTEQDRNRFVKRVPKQAVK